MPLRSRSRCSMSARKRSQSRSTARSSSSVLSKPSRITPPSLTIAAGSSTSVSCSIAATAGSTSAASDNFPSAAFDPATTVLPCTWCSSSRHCGSTGSASASATSSRGRTLPSEMRVAIRSMSAQPASRRRIGCVSRCEMRHSTRSWRDRTSASSCNGASSHCRSSRLPAAVAHWSTRDSKVAPRSSCSGFTSSRLRRATGSIAISASRRRRRIGCRWRNGCPSVRVR